MSKQSLPKQIYVRLVDDDNNDTPWLNANETVEPLIEEYGTEYRVGVYELTGYVKAKQVVQTTVSK